MTEIVEIPLWLFVLILLFAAVTALSHFLLPSVRWFFRRRFERAVKRLNTKLSRPIEPFKLARRYDMVQRLVYTPEVTQAIVDHAAENNVPENVAFQKAKTYAREIVPSFSAFAYFSFAIRLARWLANSLYEVRTEESHDVRLADLPKDATVIFIMNHRSNMDYVLAIYLAAHASTLSYAVGEWARVWPVSALIKSVGAYFIRRRSRGPLYRKVLARYVKMATDGGVTQAIFPEGGLTLDGKLRPPKLGLLTYVMGAYQPEGRDILFVPVAVNYDRVLEDRVLIAADKRGDRRFGGKVTVVFKFIMRKIWRAVSGRPLRFGTAAVSFGEPISLRSYAQMPEPEQLAADLMAGVAELMPVLDMPLLCRAMLKLNGAMTKDQLISGVEAEMRACSAIKGPVEPTRAAQSVENALTSISERNILENRGSEWVVKPKQEALLRFYSNSIDHFFRDEPPERGEL